jgi:hypothetical protein
MASIDEYSAIQQSEIKKEELSLHGHDRLNKVICVVEEDIKIIKKC